jgi:hypothetical protein
MGLLKEQWERGKQILIRERERECDRKGQKERDRDILEKETYWKYNKKELKRNICSQVQDSKRKLLHKG